MCSFLNEEYKNIYCLDEFLNIRNVKCFINPESYIGYL